MMLSGLLKAEFLFSLLIWPFIYLGEEEAGGGGKPEEEGESSMLLSIEVTCLQITRINCLQKLRLEASE